MAYSNKVSPKLATAAALSAAVGKRISFSKHDNDDSGKCSSVGYIDKGIVTAFFAAYLAFN
jgi:hypothetical protein